MKPHKLATYFPLIEGEEFDLLVEDIRKNGQHEPIVLHDGKILDGWNRYRACKAAGIEPLTEEYKGDDPLSFVVTQNIRRRHMSESQRAMLAVEMVPAFAVAAKKRSGKRSTRGSADPQVEKTWRDKRRSRDEVAAVFGISGPSVQRAKRVKEQAPDKIADVVSGKTTVRRVDAELREKRAAERVVKKKKKAASTEADKRPKVVKDYLDALRAFRDAIPIAIAAKEKGLFSPEAARMVTRRHADIKAKMHEWEKANDKRTT